MAVIITSDDDELSDNIREHRDQAFANGYEDALDNLREMIETALDDSQQDAAPADREVGLKHALSLLNALEASLP